MENNNENEEKKFQLKNSNLLLIIIGLLLFVGVGCFFLGQNTANRESSNSDGEEKQESNKKVETTTKDEKYELSKCLNCSNFDSDTVIETTANDESGIVKVNVKEDNKTVEIELSSEAVSHYGRDIKDRTIVKQLNKEIKQVLISSYGGDIGLLTIHYLMKDGTIEYIKVFDEILKDNFDDLNDDNLFNTKKFNDIKDIIKIVSVEYSGDLPSYGVIAIKSNGYFYSLDV